jgi:hypothetical protein
MTKFLNKKEQVIDLKLTTYGHYLFSIGTFKPVHYAFFDDNVVYDGAYVGLTESQSNVVHRIKNETQYLEGQTLFVDLEDRLTNAIPEADFFDLDITPTKEEVRPNLFRYDKPIGDAHLDGKELNFVPAWKIVLLNGKIIESKQRDELNKIEIPQIDISLDYQTALDDGLVNFDETTMSGDVSETSPFADGNSIILKPDDLYMYVEEVNTSTLTKNFDIEVFEVLTSSYEDSTGNTQQGTSSFIRKYFETKVPQIVDGKMMMPNPVEKFYDQIPSSSVEYYFDILADFDADPAVACRASEVFNKQSYYVDIDFDCTGFEEESIYNDIYGSSVEPEICLD